MADFKIKKWSGSAWVDAHPETTVGQIVATGTPSSSTFLRGDGVWAVPSGVDNYVNTTGDTMTGTLEFTTSTTPIKLQQDHFVYRKIDATTEAVTNQSQAYILLCRNAANNDVNGTITMDRTSGLRHASFADILISSGSSSVPVGTMRSMSTAGSGSPTYKLVTLTYSSNSYVALSIYNPDSYYDTSGMYFTGRIKTTDTSNEFLMLPAGLVTNVADFGTNESHQINGDTIWHAGNSADPDTKVSKSGDTMTGELTISHPSSTSRLNLNAVTGQSTQMLFKEAGTLKSAITYVAGSDKLILYNEADRLTIDNSGNVGIGTSSPNAQLSLVTTTNTTPPGLGSLGSQFLMTKSDGGANGNYGLLAGVSGAGWSWFQAQRVDGTATAYALNLQPSGGNVGIGTTSPENKLHINSGTTVNIAQFENNYGKTFINGSSSSINEIVSRNSDNTDYQDLTFRSQGTAQLYLDTNGRIGIGTTSPSEKLHIVGNTRIEGDLTVNGSYTQVNTVANTTEQWSVTNDGTGPAVIINQKGAQPIMDVQDDGVSALYIEDGGNVGIKTTNPTTTLQVAGRALANILSTTTANTRDKIRLWNTSGQYTIGMQSNYSFGGLNNDYAMTFQFNNDNDRGFWWGDEAHSQSQGAMALTTNGLLTVANRIRVGYGESDTTIPATYALDVSGNSYIDATSASATLTLGRYTGQPTIKAGTDDGGYLLMDSTSNVLGLNWYTNQNVIINNGGGNTGIGTTSPGARLDVLSNAKITSASNSSHSLKLEARNEYLNDTGSSGIFVTAGGSSTVSDFSSQGAHLVLETRQSSRNIYFKAGNTTSAQHIMDYNGNVGIGTTSPQAKLTVDGESNSKAIELKRTGVLTGNAALRLVGLDTEEALGIQVNDSEKVRIDYNGNVGIGTSSPWAKLTVSGHISGDGNLYLNNDNTAADTSIFFGDAASDTAHRLFFDDSDQEFRFSNSLNITGNVRSTGWMWASGNFHTNGNLYLNYDNTAADTVIYFGDAASDTAHYMLFSNAAQQYYLSDTLNMYGGVKLDHNGTGTVDSHPITFTSQFNSTDVVRELKTNSAGDLLFNGNALATEAYVTANAGGGVTSIKNFAGPYVNTNGFTAKQLPLSKTLSTGDRIGLSVIVGTTTNYGTRTQQTVWLEVGTSSHGLLFSYYDNATSTMRLYSAEVYISSGNLYIDDAVAWTDGAFGHSGSSTTAIYVMDVLEYA